MSSDGYVPDEGPIAAEIALIGEAPGANEEKQGRPFVGFAGSLLTKVWLQSAGLRRSDVRLMNVHHYRPAKNNITLVSKAELEEDAVHLTEALREMPNLKVIVPLGNVALKAVMGMTSIMKWRGSVLEWEGKHVVPTFHPAAVLRNSSWTRRVLRDMGLAVHLLTDAPPTYMDTVENWEHLSTAERKVWRNYILRAEVISVDIETIPSQQEITCVGFGVGGHGAVVIPWRTKAHIQQIRTFCESPVIKVLQNGLYDSYWLEAQDIALRNYRYDTLCLHHMLDPAEPHDLAYLTSMFTFRPYHKETAQEGTGKKTWVWNDQLVTYNGADCNATLDIMETLVPRIEQERSIPLYHTLYTNMLDPLLGMMRHGVRMDNSARVEEDERQATQEHMALDLLEQLAGYPLHGKQALSPKKLAQYIYTDLKMPRRYKKTTLTGKRSLSTEEVAIRVLMQRKPEQFKHIGELIIMARKAKQTRTFLQDQRVDADGRMRCSYRFTTESGRLASSKNPMMTGGNLQNIDRTLRHLFLPDYGCIFLEADLSQAESRVVYMLSEDQTLIEEAQTPPWEFDHHTHNAALLFDKDASDITKIERHVGKIVSHGAQRQMGGTKLSETMLKNGFLRTPKECETYIEQYMETHPGILAYFSKVRRLIAQDRGRTNGWGRQIRWEHDRMGDELFRKAYSWRPQSEVADLLNQWGLIELHKFLKDMPQANINLQVHDSLLISTPPQYAYAIAAFLKKSLERVRMYGAEQLSIPVEFKVGHTWQGAHEWSEFPSEEEFHSVIDKIEVQNE